ncbi:hypothetical protein [Sulfurimonas diazotrophicus]|uniref:Collagen-like protein n=1 Tax=Sulfurimonas diazotrophicus TaxID=3131939 RepID=A0ABZ3HBD5_9BACT
MKQSLSGVRGIMMSSAVGAALLLSGCGSSSSTTTATSGTVVGAEQATALVGTLECVLGTATGTLTNVLSAADLSILTSIPLDLASVANAMVELGLTTTGVTVGAMLETSVSLSNVLDIIGLVGGTPDVLAIVASLKDALDPATLLQTLPLGDLLSVAPSLLTQVIGTLVDTTAGVAETGIDALTFLDDTVMGVGYDVAACIPQLEPVVATLDCATNSVLGGATLTAENLKTLAVALPLGDLLGAVQSLTGLADTATLSDLLAAPLSAGDLLGILGTLSGDPQSVLSDLTGALDPSQLTNLLSLGDLIVAPQELLGTTLGTLPATLLTTTTGLLGTVEGLLAQVTGDLTSCLDPNLLVGSLTSLLGALPLDGGALPLDPAGLLSLVSADTTINDIIAAAKTLPVLNALPLDELMATKLSVAQLMDIINALPIPAPVSTVLTTVLGAVPDLNLPALSLNDILALPGEVLPFGIDPMDTSINGLLTTSVNMLALLESVAHGLNAEGTAFLLNAGVVMPVVTTIDKLGGYAILGGLMTNVPYLTQTLPLGDLTGLLLNGATPTDLGALSSLVGTILGSGDPTGALTSILSTLTGASSGDLLGLLGGDLLGSLTGTLSDLLNSLGGNLLGDLLTTLTSLLGGADASAITDLLGGLTTDPTALLQTLLGLLNAQGLALPL